MSYTILCHKILLDSYVTVSCHTLRNLFKKAPLIVLKKLFLTCKSYSQPVVLPLQIDDSFSRLFRKLRPIFTAVYLLLSHPS